MDRSALSQSSSRPGRTEHLLASDIMTKPALTVQTDTRVMAALAIMRNGEIRHLLVVHDGRLAGVLSNRDYRRILEFAKPDGTIPGVGAFTVAQIMTPRRALITGHQRTPLLNIAQLMVARKVGCVPIVDHHDRPVGVLTQKDVMRELASRALAHPEIMRRDAVTAARLRDDADFKNPN